MYKPLADSTLMSMSKKEIIEQLRIAEHNHEVCEETINQQYENFQKLLADKRAEAIDEFVKEVRTRRHCDKVTDFTRCFFVSRCPFCGYDKYHEPVDKNKDVCILENVAKHLKAGSK